MFENNEIHIPAQNIQSLCWEGDSLVDWVAGGHRYSLDGTTHRRNVAYRFVFDQAVNSPSGDYAVIYVKHGTKGLVLHKGKVLREINRSFYYANAYEYPIALLQLKNGQEVVAHCPEHYNRLELEDLATGKRLTNSSTRKPSDYFFSRLSVNDSGTHLLSAGWHWQPIDHVKVFNISHGLKKHSHFDDAGLDFDTWGENSSACFTENDQLIVSVWDDNFGQMEQGQENSSEEESQPSGSLKLFSLTESKLVSTVSPAKITGTIMPIGSTHIVGFFECPKLINVTTGIVEKSWRHINSGRQMSSITWGKVFIPPMAFDIKHRRFAIASESGITVIQLSEKQDK